VSGGRPFRRAGARDVAALAAMQLAAYQPNRLILGVEPLPLIADYEKVVAEKACWLAESRNRLDGALILEPAPGEPDALLIWSVAIAPHAQGTGLGNALMAFAEDEARAAGLAAMVLYTGEPLVKNIAWYERLGYAITRRETRPDRTIVHMRKPLGSQQEPAGAA
jgi:ribosomal protein S18 acetylase RimI-like enzyme